MPRLKSGRYSHKIQKRAAGDLPLKVDWYLCLFVFTNNHLPLSFILEFYLSDFISEKIIFIFDDLS